MVGRRKARPAEGYVEKELERQVAGPRRERRVRAFLSKVAPKRARRWFPPGR